MYKLLPNNNYSDSGEKNIYYNVKIENNYRGILENPIDAVYNKQETIILDKQSDYQMGIYHWSLRGQIPLFICPANSTWTPPNPTVKVATNSSIAVVCVFTIPSTVGLLTNDYVRIERVNGIGWRALNNKYWKVTVINATTFSIVFDSTALGAPLVQPNIYFMGNGHTPFGINYRVDNNNYPIRLKYFPDSVAGSYNIPTGYDDNSTEYFYIYTFQKFIDIVNDALKEGYEELAIGSPGVHTGPPWFQYDEGPGIISLIAEYAYSQAGSEVYCNSLLYNYFETIRVDFNGYNRSNFSDYRFMFEVLDGNQNGYALPPLPVLAIPDYLKYDQEYDARFLWGNIKAIVFTSSSIGCRQEYIPPIGLLTNVNATFNPPTMSILSYYSIIYGSGGGNAANWRQDLYYEPKFIKWIDLIDNGTLTNINIKVYMQTNTGALIPLKIPINASVDMKFRFRKKQ